MSQLPRVVAMLSWIRKEFLKEISMDKVVDMVNHPNHYANNRMRQIIGVECIDFTRHLSFDVGNAFKYVWRCSDKGKVAQDLEKAAFYLNDHLENISFLTPYCIGDEIDDLVDGMWEFNEESVSDFEMKQIEVLRKIIYSPREALVYLEQLRVMV